MKRFLGRIARFVWSWGFLKFILIAVTLIVLFYVEEDWRGARAWAATKAKWEARGESFDYYGKFVPPPVPDVENLAATPLFRFEAPPNDPEDPELKTLDQAMRAKSLKLPLFKAWTKGETYDREKLKIDIGDAYARAFPGLIPPATALAQFDALFPFLPQLRADAANRHAFRFSLDYHGPLPIGRALGPITKGLYLARILALHAILALDADQSALALDDLRVNIQIALGIQRDPTVVAGLVTLGMITIGNGAIYQGLASHEWSDADLAKLEKMLAGIDCLVAVQFAYRSEAASETVNIDVFQRMPPARSADLFQYGSVHLEAAYLHLPPWPNGWWDMNKSDTIDFLLRQAATVDPPGHRAKPEKSRTIDREQQSRLAKWDAWAPWNIYTNITMGPLAEVLERFCAAQVWIDQMRIACALERWRLAHGTYPEKLDVLIPTCIDSLPHDVVNGDPYHYRPQPEGTFLLYSVGWNQRDDGGKTVDEADGRRNEFYGDWVWPMPR